MVFMVKVDGLQRQVLHGVEQFGAASEDERRVWPGDVHGDLSFVFRLRVFSRARGRIHGDAVLEAQSGVGEHDLEKIIDAVGGGDFVGQGHGMIVNGL